MEIGSGKASFQIADKEPEGKGILAVKSFRRNAGQGCEGASDFPGIVRSLASRCIQGQGTGSFDSIVFRVSQGVMKAESVPCKLGTK